MATPSYAALQLIFDQLSRHANWQRPPPRRSSTPFLDELRKEIAEIKLVVSQILLARGQSGQVAVQQQGVPSNNAGHGRKRSAAQFTDGAQQHVEPAVSNVDPVDAEGSPASNTAADSQNLQSTPADSQEGRRPRKQVADDYILLIRQQYEQRGEAIGTIQIPVPEAFECDPSFQVKSEHAIVEQLAKQLNERGPANFNVVEAACQLCKRLAEWRVFGPRLMAQATVAGPNHSNYSNLPDEGIVYIASVCRRMLGQGVKSEDEFWDVFREAMRKLAARCRRVRHSKKTRSIQEEAKDEAAAALVDSQTLQQNAHHAQHYPTEEHDEAAAALVDSQMIQQNAHHALHYPTEETDEAAAALADSQTIQNNALALLAGCFSPEAHAKDDADASQTIQNNALALLAGCFSPEQWMEHVKQNVAMHIVDPALQQFPQIVAQSPEDSPSQAAQADSVDSDEPLDLRRWI